MVDELREYPDTRLPFKHWCHMAGDAGFDELHALGAEEVGTRDLTLRMSGPRGDRVRARRAARASG